MENFFTPRSVAVIGASSNPKKVGHVIYSQVRHLFRSYPINIKGKRILGDKTYKTILDIKDKVDLAVIAIPSPFVLETIDQCGKKGIKHVIIISAGFGEIGNIKLEHELQKLIRKYDMYCMGPNCLGVYDGHSKLDTLFLPTTKLTRPKPGGISFVTQSGAVGSAVLDKMTTEDLGFAKFISYGNGTTLSETDYLEYLGTDKETKVICMYLEGIKDGIRFLKVAKKIKKPIIVIKAGRTESGQKATMSHTGSLAGSYKVHEGAFKQANIILVESIKEMFDVAKLFTLLSAQPKKKTIQVITNGGGFGIITTDVLESTGLEMATLSQKTVSQLKKKFSKLVTVANPMDLVGDVTNERYSQAIKACVEDNNIGVLVVIVLTQTPLIDEDIVNVIATYKKKKPIIILSLGGKYTEKVSDKFRRKEFPVFEYPEDVAKALLGYLQFF